MRKFTYSALVLVLMLVIVIPAVSMAQINPGPVGSSTTFVPATTSPASTGSTSCVSLSSNDSTFQKLVVYIICIIQNYVITLIFALAMVAFIWGIVQYFILGADEEAKRTQGKQLMIWGIIALTVMMGVWSLSKIVGRTFGLDTTLPRVLP